MKGPEFPSEEVPSSAPLASAVDYRHLPDQVRLEDTVTTKESSPAPDPDGGRNPGTDFMLRYAG